MNILLRFMTPGIFVNANFLGNIQSLIFSYYLNYIEMYLFNLVFIFCIFFVFHFLFIHCIISLSIYFSFIKFSMCCFFQYCHNIISFTITQVSYIFPLSIFINFYFKLHFSVYFYFSF